MWIDTHAHYDNERFDEDREDVIKRVYEEGTGIIINASSTVESSEKSLELAKKHQFVYCTVGIHPHSADQCTDETMAYLTTLARHEKVVAIGETGLDYHYDFCSREEQKRNFIANIAMAKELKKPVVVHDRESHEDILQIMKEEKISQCGGVVHCFSGSVEMAREVVKMGLYISVGGTVTFKNARRIMEVVEYLPNDRLLLETDCPYMTPEPYRGTRNDSSYIRYIAQKIADIKEVAIEEIYETTNTNACRLFGIQI